MSRKRPVTLIAAAVTAVLITVVPGLAETYPSRYVRIITAGAGTFHDVVARDLGQRLSERWHQGVIVENQAGAGLTIGTAIAAKAAPDGYTLLLADRGSWPLPRAYTRISAMIPSGICGRLRWSHVHLPFWPLMPKFPLQICDNSSSLRRSNEIRFSSPQPAMVHFPI